MAAERPVRAYRHWEQEMLGEYLARFHPTCRLLIHVKLGPTDAIWTDPSLSPGERKLLGNMGRRWADAVCVEHDVLNVIEAAMLPDPRDISLLQHYVELVGLSPELAEFHHLPVQGILVWAIDEPLARSLAVRQRLRVDVYKPTFWTEWIATVRAREAQPSRNGQLMLGAGLLSVDKLELPQ